MIKNDSTPVWSVDWRTVCVVVVTRNMPHRRTFAAITQLVRRGASLVQRADMSCVCTIRNFALTDAIDKHSSKQTLLLVDDDVVFEQEQAEELVGRCQQTNVAHSARYIQNDGRLLALRMTKDRWYTGLGFAAIPMGELIRVAPPKARVNDEMFIYPLCTASSDDGEWYTDDFSLCKRLGGVVLANINVIHIKPMDLLPALRQSPDDD